MLLPLLLLGLLLENSQILFARITKGPQVRKELETHKLP